MTNRHTRSLGLVLAGIALIVAGCSETAIQGVILEKDLNDPELMLAVARGANSELTDIWVAGDYHYNVLSSTDDFVNDGTASGETRLAVSDFSQRPASGVWEQSLEAAWGGLKAVERMRGAFEPQVFETSPLVARAYLVAGYGERLVGDAFCEPVYDFGPEGGILLGTDGPYDGSHTVPRDSAFTRAVTVFNLALGFAERAIAAGVPNPAGADPIFEPQRLVYSAHGGLAQAHMALASLGKDPTQNWALAVEHARQVPTDFVDYSHMFEETGEDNLLWEITWDNDDVTMWGAVIDGRVIGTPATALWEDDPRVSVTHCGDFSDPDAGLDSPIRDNNACEPDTDHRSESNDFPDWAPDKYPSDGSDAELVTGTEMRLIEAEAALVAGNLAEFTRQVNLARAFHGADPIQQPATVGALEWPNAEDDAWSILDRERYLDGWLEGRRAFDLARWNHPFLTQGVALIPRHEDEIQGTRPFQCFPIPSSECNINSDLNCTVLASS